MLDLRATTLLLTVLLCGCTGVRVQSDYAAGTDFRSFETYAWLPHEDRDASDPLLEERVQRAVDGELTAKGMRRVPPNEASLLVTYRVAVEEKVQVNDPYYATFQFETYEQGTLFVDLVDPKANLLVWRGVGETRLKHQKTPEERTERVREVVEAILEQYPPRPKS